MENNDVDTQLDNLQGFLEGLGGGKSSESGGFNVNEILGQIKDFAGEHLNSENLLSMPLRVNFLDCFNPSRTFWSFRAFSTRGPKKLPKNPQNGPKKFPRAPRSSPRAPQEAPKVP